MNIIDLAKMADLKDPRPYARGVIIQGGRACVTNGYGMVYAPTHLPDGFIGESGVAVPSVANVIDKATKRESAPHVPHYLLTLAARRKDARLVLVGDASSDWRIVGTDEPKLTGERVRLNIWLIRKYLKALKGMVFVRIAEQDADSEPVLFIGDASTDVTVMLVPELPKED